MTADERPNGWLPAPPPPPLPAVDRSDGVASRGPARLLVADDNPVVLRGLVAILEATPGVVVAGTAVDGAAAVSLAARVHPDLVLLDARMPGMSGLAAAHELAPRYPTVMLSFSEDADVVAAAVAAGVRGYLVHGRFGVAELQRAVRGVLAGEVHLSPSIAGHALHHARAQLQPLVIGAAVGLTPREAEIMTLVAAGRSNAEIGSELFLGEKTVKNRLTTILAKLQARNRAEAAAVFTGRAPTLSGPRADRKDITR